MACPSKINLCFVAGDTLNINWQYTDGDDVPIDLTGATAQMQLLDKITDVVQVDDMTGGIVDAVNGLGLFSLTNTETQTLLPVILDGAASRLLTSRIRLTFADTTTKTIAGIDVTIEQGGIR